jgi:hypothetical protein
MFLKLLGRRREPILAATGATETLRYATIGDRSTVACNLDLTNTVAAELQAK